MGAPGAPVILFYSGAAALCLMTIIHSPFVFARLPRKSKWVAYGAILPVMVLAAAHTEPMNAAWERTPDGVKEAAQAANERAQDDARTKAERDAAAEREAADEKASFDAALQARCESLVPSVISLSKQEFGPEVIEINGIVPSDGGSEPTKLSCSGTAVVSRGGDRAIDFGTQTTPQGKVLVTMQLR